MRARLMLVLALGALTIHCDDDRTGATEGLTFFEHPDFEGNSITLAGGFSDFDDLRGPCNRTTNPVTGATGDGDWDNCISSVMVSPGWEGTASEHDDYQGETLAITQNITDLDDVRGPCGDDWDDCISSLQVSRR
ncbi:MAG: hypothetical protein ACRD21_06560 [Vicinamibacteria bacterium]